MEDLVNLFTIDRCGSVEKTVSKKIKEKTPSKKRNSAILYKCDSKLTEVNPLETSAKINQAHKSSIPKQLNKRMHEAALEGQRINPGKLSENLRQALGLSKYGIPMHVYRMRYLGYPPGWLKQIEVRPSELKFIANQSRSVEYRIEDLIEYPGFNTLINYDPEEDHWRELGMIPMNKDQSIEEFSSYLKNKQKKLKFEADISGEHQVPIEQLEQHRQDILALMQDIELPTMSQQVSK